eukprot:TRINITY_DN2255_c0_g1_i2.p1 TRINITY_DN2255_c0_g1~~TRINITY_DN2255_c0_g1_i2.p1  ORF type:complete len:197 (-),score=53.06 TRINITY_DN2255_c0_g1_i2:178-768(-)
MAEGIPHKLVLLGGSGVGKSNLVLRFVKDQFTEHLESTIGAAFLTQSVTTKEGKVIKFEIWDTAGQERYRSLAPMYYRGAHSAIVVYDITAPETLERAKDYIKEVKKQGSSNVVIMLAGNKTDLEGQRKVPSKDGDAAANELGVFFSETSAKTGEGVKELFMLLAEQDKRTASDLAPQNNIVNMGDTSKSSDGCPC